MIPPWSFIIWHLSDRVMIPSPHVVEHWNWGEVLYTEQGRTSKEVWGYTYSTPDRIVLSSHLLVSRVTVDVLLFWNMLLSLWDMMTVIHRFVGQCKFGTKYLASCYDQFTLWLTFDHGSGLYTDGHAISLQVIKSGSAEVGRGCVHSESCTKR